MILDTLTELHYLIDIKPHSLRAKPLKKEQITKDICLNILAFTKEICEYMDEIADLDYYAALKNLESFAPKFEQLKVAITNEVHDKNGKLRLFPAEYVEAMYIISYRLNQYFDMKQQDIARILNIDEGDYRNRWGISPAADYQASRTSYSFKLPMDNRVDYLKTILPYIGKVSANVSNSYFLGISNDLSIWANITNTNKATNTKTFKARQFYGNIRSIKELYNWAFIEDVTKNSNAIKESVMNLIDTKDIKLSEDLLRYLIQWNTKVEACNLKIQSAFAEFDLKYQKYKEKLKDRQTWINIMDDTEYDYGDTFRVGIEEYKAKKFIDKQKVCELEIDILNKEISSLTEWLIHEINMASFITKDNIDVLRYVVSLYQEKLDNFKPELFEDNISFCSMYMITQYFNKNGLSEESFHLLQEYCNSSDLTDFIYRYSKSQFSAFKGGVDIKDSSSLLDKLNAYNNEINSKSSNSIISRVLIFIDGDTYDVTNEEIQKLMEINKEFCFVITAEEKLDLTVLKEKVLESGENEYFIYTNEEVFDR